MLNNTELKRVATEFGADLVGIGSIDRFEGTPAEYDPRFIAPDAKSIIGLGFRILRGSLRGIEEGTNFYQFLHMGVMGIDEKFAPHVLRRVACYLEDHGYEGTVIRAVPDRRPADDTGANPEMMNTFKLKHAKPVSPDKPAPDVVPDFKQSAFICGLGEFGLGGHFLTPEFGPLQRFAFILTDAPLEPDPIYDGPVLCDRCGECIRACPGQAIMADKKVSRTIAGKTVEYAELDEWQCSAYYMGAFGARNPFLAPGALDKLPHGREIADGKHRLSPDEVEKVRPILNRAYSSWHYSPCICGRACYRACLVHLENEKKLNKRFKTNFRKRPEWQIAT